MPLNRNSVDRTCAEHLRQLRESGVRLTEDDKRRIRKEHERVATQVERKRHGNL